MTSALWTVARLFLWLGAISFGGPLAHIALMQRELVERRGWLSQQEFLDLSGAMSLIPGPNSTELAMALGRRRAGTAGLWTAGVCFIAPAFCIVLTLALFYARIAEHPMTRALLFGVQPVVIAIIAQAGARLLPTACKNGETRLLAALAFALSVAHAASELLILFGAAGIGLLLGWLDARREKPAAPLDSEPELPQVLDVAEDEKCSGKAGVMLLTGGAAGVAGAKSWWLFWTFLKIGSVLYGSGYVLLAFLRDELAPKYLSDQQLLDAVSIGQITPGPVFTTATFIGALLGGPSGALAATIGIFLPSFLLVGWLLRVLERVQGSLIARRFLDAVNAASLALMAGVALELGRAAIVDWTSAAIALAALGVLWRTNWNSAWLIAGGAAAGILHAGALSEAWKGIGAGIMGA